MIAVAGLVLALVMVPVTVATAWRMRATDRRLAVELDKRMAAV